MLRREAVHYVGCTHPTENSRAAAHSSSDSGHRLCGLEMAVQPENAGSQVFMFSKSTFLHLVTKQNITKQQNLKSKCWFIRLLFQPHTQKHRPRGQLCVFVDSKDVFMSQRMMYKVDVPHTKNTIT